MNIKNRQEFLVVLTVAAVGLLVAVNFILTPLANHWSARQKQIKDLRDQISRGQTLIKGESRTRTQWSDMVTNSLAANPSQAEQQFLNGLLKWSRDSGAQVTSIMPQWKNESTNYLTLACRVETAGDMNTLSKFLYDVEKGPLALKVDAMELTSRDPSGQQITLSLEINGLALTTQEKK